MKIIIVGCSRVGETLAEQLSREKNDITVIDLSSDKIDSITSKYDVMGIVGNGATYTTLVEAGVNSADLLIAVTDSDELNLLCCLIAKKNGKCRVIARVTSPEYNNDIPYLKDELGLEMIINPEAAIAEEIARVLRFPSAMKIETFAKGRVELLTFRLPEESLLVKMKVRDLVTKLRTDILVCAVERDGVSHIPNGDFVFEARDIVSIVSSPRKAYNFFKKINYATHEVKNVLIAGITKITHYLCDALRNSGISVKVIDKDYEACDDLCSKFPDVTVINGDEADQKLLKEEGIDTCGAFIALTNQDEKNIVLSLFAKSFNLDKIVTKINRSEYEAIVKHLDLDTTFYPKYITADIIVRYVRAMKNVLGSNVETMYSITPEQVEASEFIIGEGSPVVETPLSQMKFKSDILIAAILRKRTVMIPRGYDVIRPGDSVVVVSRHKALRDVADILDQKSK